MAEGLILPGEMSPEQRQQCLDASLSLTGFTPSAINAEGVFYDPGLEIRQPRIDTSFRVIDTFETEYGTRVTKGVGRIGNAAIKYTDEEPLDFEDPEPILIIPGFEGIEAGYADLRAKIARNRRRARTYKVPRVQDGLTPFHLRYLFAPERLTSQAGYANVRHMNQAPHVKGVHVLGHSMGGPIGANIADHKKSILSLTLVGAAGLEDHSMLTLGRRLPGFICGEVIPALPKLCQGFELEAAYDALEYMLRNPHLTISEVRQVSRANIRPLFRRLLDKNIRVNVIQMEDDHLFDERNVHNEVARLVSRYIRTGGNHLKPQTDAQDTADEALYVMAA